MHNRTSGKSIVTRWHLSLAVILMIAAGSLLMARDILSATVPGHTITVRIPAVIDATLIESTNGQLANGAGGSLFVGRTQQPNGSRRRALVQFDVAAVVPRRAIIEDVTLFLTVTQSNAPPIAVGVHRVMQPWRRGPGLQRRRYGRPRDSRRHDMAPSQLRHDLLASPGRYLPLATKLHAIDRRGRCLCLARSGTSPTQTDTA